MGLYNLRDCKIAPSPWVGLRVVFYTNKSIYIQNLGGEGPKQNVPNSLYQENYT